MTELKEAKTNNNDNNNDEYNGWFPSWNLANNKGCFNAEQNLVKAFVDKGIKSESKQIKINFDATPQSQLKKNQKLNHNKIEYIHTLSFKVTKQFFKSETKTDNNNNNNTSNNNEQKIENKTGIEEHWHKRELSKSNLYSHTMSDLDAYIIKHLNKNNNNNNDNNSKVKTKMDPIVLLHGYGSASGMYIHTINTIFKTLYMLLHDNIELYPIIYVLDWLGNGQSSRPQFKCRDCNESETFFIESLEEWRKSMKINKFVYIGHSLGGYLGVVYTIKYGIHVSKLILVSPAGIPIKPDNVDPLAHMNLTWKGKLLFNTFKNIVWNTGLTPHDFFRMIGSKSKTLIPELIEKRLFRLKNNNNNSTINNELFKKLLGEYMFHVICQKGSGMNIFGIC